MKAYSWLLLIVLIYYTQAWKFRFHKRPLQEQPQPSTPTDEYPPPELANIFQTPTIVTALSNNVETMLQQIPVLWHNFWRHAWQILTFQPPIGIVGIYSITKLLRPRSDLQGLEDRRPRGVAWQLSAKDPYPTMSVRQRLLLVSVAHRMETTPEKNSESLQAIREGLGSDLPQLVPALINNNSKDPLVREAMLTLQVRFWDALLRSLRNHMLPTTHRLSRTTLHWKRRKQLDRWEYAHAALISECQRLGQVVRQLEDQPDDWPSHYLLEALQATETIKLQNQKKKFPETTKILKLPTRYSIRWQQGLQLRRLDLSDLQGAPTQALVQTKLQHNKAAHEWCRQCPAVLFDIIEQTLLDSIQNDNCSREEWAQVRAHWPSPDSLDQILRYVDASARWRRVGEAKAVRFQDLTIVRFLRQFNVWGIPQALLRMAIAQQVHWRMVRPHVSTIQAEFVQLWWKLREILQVRLWDPLKGIYDDIMNQSPGILSGFGVDEEQTSLDHMLRDMGFGDGTAATRTRALQKAANQYEETLRSGVVVNVVKGRLARQLLVQVQQLKVNLLTALDTIDVLMKGNRIHFQILAAIPAVIAVTYGTRLFVRSLYSLRAKDVRPLFAVYREMSTYVDQMEGLLVPVQSTRALSDQDLGELVLLVHRYLTLLDFASPPFPARNRDSIQEALQQLLADEKNPIAWLQIVQRKHKELSNYF